MADYINREASIVDFERCNHENPAWTPQRVKTLLMRIPAADVEPVVRANWQLLAGSPGTFRCSNCGAEFEENPYAQYRGKWTGCPACRAKMQMIMDLEDENDG